MKYDTETLVYVVRELFKIPLDKENKTSRYDDIITLIHNLIQLIPEEEQEELLNKLKEKDAL